MKYYAIQNKQTGRFVAGTDYRYSPRRQVYADEDRAPLLLPTDPRIYRADLEVRNISLNRFNLVEIEIGSGSESKKVDTHTREGFTDA